VSQTWVEETIPCPYCPGGAAEPEQDGAVRFHACTECGSEFGYQRVPLTADTCQAGIPIRDIEAASPAGQPVFLGSTISRRAE
jgi:hypothetical protein